MTIIKKIFWRIVQFILAVMITLLVYAVLLLLLEVKESVSHFIAGAAFMFSLFVTEDLLI